MPRNPGKLISIESLPKSLGAVNRPVKAKRLPAKRQGKNGRSTALPLSFKALRRESRTLGKKYMEIDKWSFGLTMTIVGMGGTFLTLWILGLVMDLLKKVYPLAAKGSGTEKKS
jgi:hypothetical protein